MGQYIRLGIIPAEEVIGMMESGKLVFYSHGVRVGISSVRMRTYLKGLGCVNCSRKGKFFAIEKTRQKSSNWHLNLYHQNDDGVEVMMTSDHIIAKSVGGNKSSPDNRQPMCIICNSIKAHYGSVEEGRLARKVLYGTNWNKKLEKAKRAAVYCAEMLFSNDTSKNWATALKRHQSYIHKYERNLNELEQNKIPNGINGQGKSEETLHSAESKGGQGPNYGRGNSSNGWWGFIKKAYAPCCRSCSSWWQRVVEFCFEDKNRKRRACECD